MINKKAQIGTTITWFAAFLIIFFIMIIFIIFSFAAGKIKADLKLEETRAKDTVFTKQIEAFLNTPIDGNNDVYDLIIHADVRKNFREMTDKDYRESDEYKKAEKYSEAFNENANQIFYKIFPTFIVSKETGKHIMWKLIVHETNMVRFGSYWEKNYDYFSGGDLLGICVLQRESVFSELILPNKLSLFLCFDKEQYALFREGHDKTGYEILKGGENE